MTVFESLNETTHKATDSAEKYLSTSKDYLKLKTFQQLAITLSLTTKLVVIGGFVGLALVFFAVASAIAIGESLDNLPLGYVIVGIVLMTIAIVAFLIRKKMDKTIITSLSTKFFD